jgi:lipoprotein signal peptidase
VFNVADSAISAGVISMLLFHRDFLRSGSKQQEVVSESSSSDSDEEE